MSKTFTCCELIKRIKNSRPYAKWSEKDKYLAIEFLQRVVFKSYNEKGEPIEDDNFVCEECFKWFNHNAELQKKIIDKQIEKEIAEGTFHTKPGAKEALEQAKKKIDKYQKDSQEKPLDFGKSPQE